MNIKLYFFGLVVLFGSATALYSQEEGDVNQEEPVQMRPLEENIFTLVRGNNTFAFELYSRLKSNPGNLFFSPYSISAALVMPYAGSGGATKSQFQSVMHYLAQDQNLFEAFAALNQTFSTPSFTGPNETRLFIANSLWLQKDLKILPSFLETAAKYFRAAIKQVDFMRNPDAARLNINDWVKERTQGRIDELLQQSDINNMTRIVVVSSIFMKAVWQQAFDPVLTASDSFFVSPTNTTSVPMMTTSAFFRVDQAKNYTMLEMPYRQSTSNQTHLSLLIFLPRDTFGLPAVESSALSNSVDGLLKNAQNKQVIVSFPKFKLAEEFNLNRTLQQMGLTLPFSPGADFSGITGDFSLELSDVIHKAYLSIDEKGTEAVAATAVTIGVKSILVGEPALVFKADHPFMFMIVDRATNSILFIGRYVAPE